MRRTILSPLLSAALLGSALSAHGATYPQPSQKKLIRGSPAYVLTGFLLGWKKGDYTAIRPYLQLSYRSDESMAKLSLKVFFDSPLLGAELLKVEPVAGMGDMLVDVKARIWTKTGKGVEKRVWKFRLVRESKPQVPDPKGQWGVNPAVAEKVR